VRLRDARTYLHHHMRHDQEGMCKQPLACCFALRWQDEQRVRCRHHLIYQRTSGLVSFITSKAPICQYLISTTTIPEPQADRTRSQAYTALLQYMSPFILYPLAFTAGYVISDLA